jgi:glycosyltransferase involved in cell wall biosynthesis
LVKNPEEILRKSKVIVMPSLTDFSPNAVVEALNEGASIVVSKKTGSREMANSFFEHSDAVFESEIANVESLFGAMQSALKAYPKRKILPKLERDRNEPSLRLSNIQIIKRDFYPNLMGKNASINTPRVANEFEIVIPHFNQFDYLEELIENLIGQGVDKSRIIVIDDGSDKDCVPKVKKLQERFNLNVIYQTNKGLPATRNRGLELVTSPYVLFIDSDDLIELEYLEESIEILSTYKNVAAIGCWIDCFEENTETIGTFDAISPMSAYKNTLNTSSLVWKTEAIRSLGGFDKSMRQGYEDFDVACKALTSGYVIPVIDKPYFKYRVRPNSMYQSMHGNLHLKQVQKILMKNFANKPEVLSEALNFCLTNGNPTQITSIFAQSNASNFYTSPSSKLRSLGWRFPFLKSIWPKLPVRLRSLVLRYL